MPPTGLERLDEVMHENPIPWATRGEEGAPSTIVDAAGKAIAFVPDEDLARVIVASMNRLLPMIHPAQPTDDREPSHGGPKQ